MMTQSERVDTWAIQFADLNDVALQLLATITHSLLPFFPLLLLMYYTFSVYLRLRKICAQISQNLTFQTKKKKTAFFFKTPCKSKRREEERGEKTTITRVHVPELGI